MPSIVSASTKTAKPAGTGAALTARAAGAPPAAAWPPFAHGRRSLPGLALAARPALVLLTAALLTGLSAALAGRSASSGPDPAEFVLLADASSSKLKDTRAEPPAAPPAPAVRVEPNRPPAGPKEQLSSPPPAPLPPLPEPREPELLAPAVTQAPVAPLPAPQARGPTSVAPMESPRVLDAPARTEPAVDSACDPRILHQGDRPMIRNWKMLGLPTILAAALVVAPSAPAAEELPKDTGEKHPAEVLQGLTDQVRDLTRALDDLKASIKKDVDGIQLNTKVGFDKVAADVNRLKQEMADLRSQLDELKKRPGSTTVSGYSGNGAGTARVRMINSYAEQITVVVNDKYFYKVNPGETKVSDQIPAGTFTYEVLGVQPVRTRTVAAEKTFTFEVHPQGS